MRVKGQIESTLDADEDTLIKLSDDASKFTSGLFEDEEDIFNDWQ